MKTVTKRYIGFLFTLFMLVPIVLQNINTAYAATTGIVYKYSSMLEDGGRIFYIQEIEGKTSSYDIYRLDVSTGSKTKMITSKNPVISMAVYNNNLYYSSYKTGKTEYSIYSVSMETGDKKIIGPGQVVYVDENGIFYTVSKTAGLELYKKAYENEKAKLVFKGNSSFYFVKNIHNTLYFCQYTKDSQLSLLMMPSKSSKLKKVADSKIKQEPMATSPIISDVATVNGNLYYQYGTYQGSGSFWYGTIVRIDAGTKKKTAITKNSTEADLFCNETKIFYNGTESSEKKYVYNTKTGKTSTYLCNIADSESFDIIGAKTYCAKPDGKKYITVSCFTSGTNKKDMIKNLVKFEYPQESKLSYWANVKKLGTYLLIPVECTDFNDPSYGWRGKCVGISWYVTDQDGTILADFK